MPIRALKSASLALAAILLLDACRNVDVPSDGEGDAALRSQAAATLPAGFQETSVTGSLTLPTAMAMAPDGRIFVCEKAGKIRVIKDGALLPDPFLSRSVNSAGERGMLGIAFDPDFANTRHVFVYYTTNSPYHNRLSRYTASLANPDRADTASETILLDLDNLSDATNHNGGAIHFGPDGKLYVAVGENATNANSQSMSNLLGKLLRLNKDGSIPADNPFYGSASGNNRAIWALGLRNPFTFAFQPGTGKLFINDVGWMSWEEINEGVAGANYGWPTTEGPTTDVSFKTPFHSYRNTRNTGSPKEGCAIIGAAFYNPAQSAFPGDYAGDFFYGDYCDGWIKRIDPATRTVTGFAAGISSLVDIQVAGDGALYYLTHSGGDLMKVTYSGSLAPSVSQHPQGMTVTVGAAASFTVAASGTGLAYQWQRNLADIPGAGGSTYSLASPQVSDSGARFRCVVTNAQGSDTSDEATLHVTSNKPPTASISAPDGALLFRAGTSIAYSGSATDPEDGALAGSRFTWQVDLHHETHVHPLMAAVSGSTGGTLAVPAEGESSANVWLRFHLTVTDKEGLTHQVHRDVHPRKATVTLATNPAGLRINLDGVPFTAPHAFEGVAGHKRVLEAAYQASGGRNWEFVSWSDGGAAEHGIDTPDSNRTYTATFREATVANTAPTAAIAAPAETTLYQAGTAIAFSGSGTDAETAVLPDSLHTWRADLLHDGHTHAVLPVTRAKSGSFTIPAGLELSTSVFLRITLTVRDPQGLSHIDTLDLQPRKVQVTLATRPSGLQVRLDGTPRTAPYVFTGVAGVTRALQVMNQDAQGKSWRFVSWSDGGAASHNLVTPSSDATVTASFEEAISTGIRK